ncbi:hypothetical protein SLE2022_266720 [Rubroshorea leprosula]
MGDVEERVEDAEYESESEDLALFLLRRREATDDDEEVEDCETVVSINRKLRMDYGDESDGLDGLPEYYDDVSYIDELEELAEEVTDDFCGVKEPGDYEKGRAEDEVTAMKLRSEMERDASSVPKVGGFYMHDDRFGFGRGPRQRQNWNLWELKEEAKWKHDKFEEMKLQETHNTELNASKAQRASTDCCQGPKERERIRVSMLHDNSANQGNSSRKVRGRGPVRYRPLLKSSSTVEPQTKSQKLIKPPRSTSKTCSARVSAKNKQPGEILGMNSNTDSTSAFSYPLNAARYSYEFGLLESLSRAVQSKDALVGNGSRTLLSSKGGSLQYSRTQDGQNLNVSQEFMPVTQVGDLHFDDICDPVQSQVGFGNSKMLWLPALWGNTGAPGAIHLSAFVTPGAAPYADSLGLSPTHVASGEASTTERHIDIGPSVKTDQVDGEHWRQKIGPRRYSRMKLQE